MHCSSASRRDLQAVVAGEIELGGDGFVFGNFAGADLVMRIQPSREMAWASGFRGIERRQASPVEGWMIAIASARNTYKIADFKMPRIEELWLGN